MYLTSKPGEPTKHDYFGVLASKRIPVNPAASVDELAAQSDILFICCGLSDSTKGLVDRSILGKMKSTAILVNTARGPIVDNDALAEVLREGKLFGAGLDVVAGEPNIPADHSLVKEPRCVICRTFHVSSRLSARSNVDDSTSRGQRDPPDPQRNGKGRGAESFVGTQGARLLRL